MRHSWKTGISFGMASGIITTMGLMVGLHSGTGSKPVVVGGILTIAIADAFSDALGIHISEESENRHSAGEIWEASLATFLSKFFFASTFIVPLLLFPLPTAILISVLWGLSLLGVFSFHLAKGQKAGPWKVTFEHIGIALVVVALAHQTGDWIASAFR